MLLRFMAIVALLVTIAPARANAAADYVWVQWEADGKPHVRAIVAGGVGCPTLSIGTTATPLAERAPSGNGFADSVCDAVLPPGATNASVDARVLPKIPRAPQRIAVFGDSGCRLKGNEVQACNDPVAWPLAPNAAQMAKERPDLVIHVGDYYYRETPCPSTVNCTNSPHGDNSDAWVADFFQPLTPLFAAAPFVLVRGNHEDCQRSPLGWARYLSGLPEVVCARHEAPAFVAFDNLLLGNVDSAYGNELDPNPPVYLGDEAAVETAAVNGRRETWLLTHRPPLAYEATHGAGDPAGRDLAAILSGHLHLFGAYDFPAEAPQLILGIGGDNLAAASEVRQVSILGGTTEARFGYALFERVGDGWNITVHDTNGAVHRRCRLAARHVSCTAALTG